MFERRVRSEKQAELWVVAGELPPATPDQFYRRIERTLERMDFAQQVWAICTPAYADLGRGGRPGIDPVVYLKMLMVGFFENLPSERAIASRCADSLSIRGFLRYSLTEATPDHSSLSIIRQRLSTEQLHTIHGILLKVLHGHGLLRGRKLGIDSSVIEANASLRELTHRNTAENYWDYVCRLAAAAGVDTTDSKAVRRFDRQRGKRKTSNQDWQNPHDPTAKVGRTKAGATDMIYQPEHVVDLESGAIVQVEVRPGDVSDKDATLCERVMSAVGALSAAVPELPVEKLGEELCADGNYFALGPITELHGCGVRTVISDPQAKRRKRKHLSAEHRAVLRRAGRATKSVSGKALLRKRGEHLERSFCHLLDHGGLRRTTLRGTENLQKRYVVGALTYNLSLLLRKLCGLGTPKQALAASRRALFWWWQGLARVVMHSSLRGHAPNLANARFSPAPSFGTLLLLKRPFSTGC